MCEFIPSCDDLGVKGGDGCDCECDLTEWDPFEDDWRLCETASIGDLFVDFCIFSGATTTLESRSIPCSGNVKSTMVNYERDSQNGYQAGNSMLSRGALGGRR